MVGHTPVTAPSSEELREAIAREETRVARLEDERMLAQARLDALRGSSPHSGPAHRTGCFP